MSGSKPHQVTCHGYRSTKKTVALFSYLSINYPISELILRVLEAQETPLYHLRQTLSWVHTELLYLLPPFPSSGGWGRGQNHEKCRMRRIFLEKKKSCDNAFMRTYCTNSYWNSTADLYWPINRECVCVCVAKPLLLCLCLFTQHKTDQTPFANLYKKPFQT